MLVGGDRCTHLVDKSHFCIQSRVDSVHREKLTLYGTVIVAMEDVCDTAFSSSIVVPVEVVVLRCADSLLALVRHGSVRCPATRF